MINRIKERGKEAKKSGFVYHERTAEAVKQRATQTGGRFDSPFKQGVDTWRPKAGDNLIRLLPPTWDDHEHYGYELWVHKYIGADNSTYLCPQKMKNTPCPICKAAKLAKDAGEADEAKQLVVQKMVCAYIIDRDEKKPTPILYNMGWSMDRDIASLSINSRTGKVLMLDHPDKGYDVTIKRTGEGLRTRYQVVIDRDPTSIDDDPEVQSEILDQVQDNPVPDQLRFYDEDYLEKVLSGVQETKDPDAEEEDKPARRRARSEDDDDDKPAKRSRKDDEPDEEEEKKPSRRSSKKEEPEEDEEEVKPRRRSRDEDDDDKPSRRSAKEEPEEDEDEKPARRTAKKDEEEEEVPRRRASRDEPEEDEKPARRRSRDDDDDKPARAKKEEPEEEDEKPSRRRAAPEEDEDEKPARRSSKKDEDDDPPSKRRRPADEEEEDPAPRRRRSED